jgi:flagellin
MGAFSILNNISGLNSQNQLTSTQTNLSRTLLRLSSGKRINSGADDAAGLQIADSLRANVRALDQAVRNANEGVGAAQIADGALSEMGNLLTRAVTLATEAATETVDSAGRVSLDNEFTQIESEIARIAKQTNFNGVKIFDASGAADTNFGGALNVFVGDTTNVSSIAVTVAAITTGTSGTDGTVTGGMFDLSGVDLKTSGSAASSLTNIKTALGNISKARSGIGSGINRLQAAAAVIQTQSQNTTAAESIIRDANFAEEVSNLTKYQILSQSGIASMSQANSSSQMVLSLLR